MRFDKNILAAIVLFIIGVCISYYTTSRSAFNLQFKNISEHKDGIISLNPAATEIIYALGSQDKLKAVSRFCNFPTEAGDKPIAGDFLNPDFERILAINPEYIVVMGKSQKITSFCQTKGYEVIELNLFDLDGVYNDIIMLSEKLNCKSNGEQLISRIKSDIDLVRQKTASLEKTKIFISMAGTSLDSLNSLPTVNGKTLISQLVQVAGGENVFSDISDFFPEISKESLVVRQPKIIIQPSFKAISQEEKISAKKLWSLLPGLPAVKNDKIYFPDADLILKPGPRIGKAALELAQIIHPEAFNNE